jgi:hypothetical protein
MAGSSIPLVKASLAFLPEDWGSITQTFEGTPNRLIIIFENQPNDYSIQFTQAHILQAWVDTECIRLATCTAAEGELYLGWFGASPNEEVKRITAAYLVKRLIMKGLEYCIVREGRWKNFPIIGVEDMKLYFETLDVFKKMKESYASKNMTDAIEYLKKYQVLCKRRAKVLCKNTLRVMSEYNTDICVQVVEKDPSLYPHVYSFYQTEGVSFIAIRPKSSSPQDWDRYMKRIKGESDEIDKFFQQLSRG